MSCKEVKVGTDSIGSAHEGSAWAGAVGGVVLYCYGVGYREILQEGERVSIARESTEETVAGVD